MWKIALRRLARVILTLLVVSAGTFALTGLLPGDPAKVMLGLRATEENVALVREQLHLTDPLPLRYVHWLGSALTGDLGQSYLSGRDVAGSFLERLPVSLELMLLVQFLSLAVAVPVGVLAAHRAGSWLDKLLNSFLFATISVPNFILAVALVGLFALALRWLPATGWVPFTQDPVGNLRSLALPSLTLALGQVGVYARVLRTDLIGTLQEDFIGAARAKGTPTASILFRHALRPSSLNLMTVAGLNFAQLISGAVIVESIFALPGVGSLMVTAISNRDYTMVQGGVLLIAAFFVLVNFTVDMLYTVVDPRMRHVDRLA